MEALTNMISLILIFKIFLLLIIFGIFSVSYFHTRETLRMEKRLGLVIPGFVTSILSSHVFIAFFMFIMLAVLFFV